MKEFFLTIHKALLSSAKWLSEPADSKGYGIYPLTAEEHEEMAQELHEIFEARLKEQQHR